VPHILEHLLCDVYVVVVVFYQQHAQRPYVCRLYLGPRLVDMARLVRVGVRVGLRVGARVGVTVGARVGVRAWARAGFRVRVRVRFGVVVRVRLVCTAHRCAALGQR